MKLFISLLLLSFLWMAPSQVLAQSAIIIEPTVEATESADATASAQDEKKEEQEDVTKPEEPEEREEVFKLFEQRPANELTFFNATAYALQAVVKSGVPANTVVLILLMPVLATIVVFFRYVIGLPSLGILVPIALSITLLATGITAGLLLLATVIFGSIFSRILLKRIRIMQLPKIALSLFVISLLIVAVLAVSALGGLIAVKQLSIFPVLLSVILSERIVTLQLERSFGETINITFVTLLLGVIGFLLLSFEMLRNFVLLYPEVILLVVPVNILIGRYFGLRLNEYFRFSHIRDAAK